jgi:putative endonuclease
MLLVSFAMFRPMWVERNYYVYILASRRLGTVYTGITGNLEQRVYQHKNDIFEGFTKRYGVHRLVWFEVHGDVTVAIAREAQIKGWNRAWKIRMIEKSNPEWRDLAADWYPSFPKLNLSSPASRA